MRYGEYFGLLLNSVENPGWFVPDVGGDASMSSFAYTVGLWHTFGHPELLVLGLPPGLGGSIVDSCGKMIKDGGRFEAGTMNHDVLVNYPAAFIDVHVERYRDYALSVEWFYGHHLGQSDPVPLLQLVWPSKTEPPMFPWDVDYPADEYHEQPLLGQPIRA